MMIVVRKVALDLVGHNLLDCLLDAICDHLRPVSINECVSRIFYISIMLRSHVDAWNILACRKRLTTMMTMVTDRHRHVYQFGIVPT